MDQALYKILITVPFVWLASTVVGIIAAVHAVFHVRTSQGAIAWAISLVTFPYVSVPAYLIFGRKKFSGYRTAFSEALERHRKQTLAMAEGLVPHFVEFSGPRKETMYFLERISNLPFTRGNRAALLIDGAALFDDLLREIDRAQHHIHMQFYIVRDDVIGRRVLKALTAAAGRGVKICFLYDEIGSWRLGAKYVSDLRAAGIQASGFRTTQGRRNLLQLNFRNHRKTTVIDGKIGYIGGINLGDEYLGESDAHGRWRDTQLRVEGPAVTCLQLVFLADWYWATRQFPEFQTAVACPSGDDDVMILPTGPMYTDDRSVLYLVEFIDAARERLWIATPYFIPDPAIFAVLRRAAVRNVDVRLLLPRKADHLATWLAAFAHLDDLLEDGVKVYWYEPGFMHQKVILVDNDLCSIGTINFDNRSLRLNFEQTAIVQNKVFAASVADMLSQDFSESTLVTKQELAAKSALFRFGVRLSRLFDPIL